MKSIKDLNLKEKTAVIRVNFNVPIKDAKVLDDLRMKACIPTIKYAKENAKKVVLLAHLGRPQSKELKYTLKPLVEPLQEMIGGRVIFINQTTGKEVVEQIKQAPENSVILLENVRFSSGEESNNPCFVDELAQLGDVYINEAFGDSAKKHASIFGLANHLPSAYGLRFIEEVQSLSRLKDHPEHPFSVIIGGAKIKEKMGAVKELGKRVDQIMVGGAVANTMFKAQGLNIAQSFYKEEEVELAKELLKEFSDLIILPIDVKVAKKIGESYDTNSLRNCRPDEVQSGESILDIGEKTVDLYLHELKHAQDIFWAGPLGYIEWEKTAQGSKDILEVLAEMDNYTAIGGGETGLMAQQAGLRDNLDFVSTGGSAALKFLSGEELAGII